MRGFEVTLTPSNESGKTRNADFFRFNARGLPNGGTMKIDERSGILICRWEFPKFIPDFAKKALRTRVLATLEESLKGTHNVTYKVETF